jgi:PAS domain S-box-containing protein
MLEQPAGKRRNFATWWAFAASVACALLLWHNVAQINARQSEIMKIINYSTDGIVVCDRNGKVLFANDATQTITGFSERDLVDSGLAQIIPNYLHDKHRQGLERAKDKSARGIEGVFYRNIYPVTRKDGETIICLISVGSVLHFGGPQFFAYITPVAEPTERKSSVKPGALSSVPSSSAK